MFLLVRQRIIEILLMVSIQNSISGVMTPKIDEYYKAFFIIKSIYLSIHQLKY